MVDRIEIQPKKPGENNDAVPPAPGEQALGKLRQEVQKKDTANKLGQIAQQLQKGAKQEAEEFIAANTPLVQERTEVVDATAQQLEKMQADLKIEGAGGQGK